MAAQSSIKYSCIGGGGFRRASEEMIKKRNMI